MHHIRYISINFRFISIIVLYLRKFIAWKYVICMEHFRFQKAEKYNIYGPNCVNHIINKIGLQHIHILIY